MTQRRHFLQTSVACAAGLMAPAAFSQAAAWPSKPINYLVAFPAGGTTDILARLVSQKLGPALGTTLVIENRGGAGGSVGSEVAARAPADGHHLLGGTISSHAINVSLYPKLGYDPIKSFTPVYLYGTNPVVLVVAANSPYKSLRDLMTAAKANPGKLTGASAGNGTSQHLAQELLAFRGDVKFTHVPFKGSADGVQAVLGGHVMSHSDATGWAPQVEAGTMRLLATYGSKRTKRWPNVPTLNELGYDTVSDSPFGIGGPKGMDPAVVKRLHDAFKSTLQDPAVMASFDKYDQSVIYMGTEEYTRFIQNTFQSEKATIERLGLAMKS